LSQDWDVYLCNVNSKLASIFVDLGIRAEIPDEKRPWLLWLWLSMKHPRPDGLSSTEEFDTLIKIEDALVAEMKARCDAVLSGRITTESRREFYFYAPSPDGFEAAAKSGVNGSVSLFNRYKFTTGTKYDPAWAQYIDVLYPADEQRQDIENRRLLDRMRKQGDPLTAGRDVSHWAYFPKAEDRKQFETSVTELGFRVVSQSESPDPARAFGICIAKRNSMTQFDIDVTIRELSRFARAANGEYDGWECELMAAKQPD
jgi:hypothetical protein